MGTYGFNTGEAGLAFVAKVVGQIIFAPTYMAYMYFVVDPRIAREGLGPPEHRLIPALSICQHLTSSWFVYFW